MIETLLETLDFLADFEQIMQLSCFLRILPRI